MKLFTPLRFGDHSAYSYPAGTFENVPDIDADRGGREILSWEMTPGDCLVFHMRTLHRAPAGGDIAVRRRAFSTRWLGDDAVYAKRPGATFPEFPPPHPKVGGPMDHPAFPIVWRRGDSSPKVHHRG